MRIEFNPMSDDRYANQQPILLNVAGVIHEATYELSRNWFYLHNHWQHKGDTLTELPELIPEDDERLLGWAFCELEESA